MLNGLRSKPSYRAAWRLTLDEVLTNTAPPPYNLSAFITYLAQSYCLETLDFILEARQYCEWYKSLVKTAGGSIGTIDSSACMNLSMIYRVLLTTYILPGAPREINLSVDLRDALLRFNDMSTPPPPEALEPAVKSIHDLMEGSIFDSFLNSRSTFLQRDRASGDSNQNDNRSDRSCTDPENQPTKPDRVKATRRLLRRTWSWPPWSH
ncbi:hypothetical protein N7474_006811 [Penicillium riverlandense]|uniref:uncharacterized protein n=1 Tax=Penicillium riverlandense TaxID=1903569 RepID=UPI00254685DF|nr:uncharacterized protein N7474_006811 [Penicillium riverlandense]KAJ5815034.1 hypothetical protein N7474_006811 [Penicillium riverlandense]